MLDRLGQVGCPAFVVEPRGASQDAWHELGEEDHADGTDRVGDAIGDGYERAIRHLCGSGQGGRAGESAGEDADGNLRGTIRAVFRPHRPSPRPQRRFPVRRPAASSLCCEACGQNARRPASRSRRRKGRPPGCPEYGRRSGSIGQQHPNARATNSTPDDPSESPRTLRRPRRSPSAMMRIVAATGFVRSSAGMSTALSFKRIPRPTRLAENE